LLSVIVVFQQKRRCHDTLSHNWIAPSIALGLSLVPSLSFSFLTVSMMRSKKRHRLGYRELIVFTISCAAVFFQFCAFPGANPYNYDEIDIAIDVDIAIAIDTAAPLPTISKERRAIFMISMGKDAAKGNIVERCLFSIRRRGNWTGYVVLLTDAPPARYKYLPSQQKDDHFIVLHPRKQDFKFKAQKRQVKDKVKVNDLPYKRFKMMQLNYIDLDPRLANIDLVYYLDIDIVVGAPLQIFFDYIEDKYNILGKNRIETSVSKAFFFKGNDENFPLQGGQFILERPHSKYCMDQWLHLLDTTPKTTKDQTSLRILAEQIQNKTETNCELVIMEQYPHLYFPSNPVALKNMMKAENYTTLNHFKNTHTALSIDEDIQAQFIAALLNMTQEEGKALGVAKKIIFRPGR
jgi:hypothetical protein